MEPEIIDLKCDGCGAVLGTVWGRKIEFGNGAFVATAPAEIKCACGRKTIWFGQEEPPRMMTLRAECSACAHKWRARVERDAQGNVPMLECPRCHNMTGEADMSGWDKIGGGDETSS